MNDSRKLYRLFTLSTLCLTLVLSFVRTAALLFSFDRTVGYLQKGGLSTLLYIVVILFLLSAGVYAFLAKKAAKQQLLAIAPDAASSHLSVRLCSVLAAVTFALAGLWESLAGQSADTPALLRVLGASLAIIYFAIPQKNKTFLLGLGPIAYFVFVLVTEYFDWTVPMNSPIKLMQQISAVCIMLLLCAEMMQFAGKSRPERYTVCTALAVFFGLSNGLSLIPALVAGGIVRTDYVLHAMPALAIGAYAMVRLLQNCEIILPAPAKEIDQPCPEEEEKTESSQDLPTTNNEEN